MTTQSTKSRPQYRACFSARNGTDRNGKSVLTYPVEIGAAFTRREAEKGLILKFNIIPTALQDGVLFLMPVDEAGDDQGDLLDSADTA